MVVVEGGGAVYAPVPAPAMCTRVTHPQPGTNAFLPCTLSSPLSMRCSSCGEQWPLSNACWSHVTHATHAGVSQNLSRIVGMLYDHDVIAARAFAAAIVSEKNTAKLDRGMPKSTANWAWILVKKANLTLCTHLAFL